MNIRFANKEDTRLLLPLYDDLGYPCSFDDLYQRLSRLLKHPDYFLLVAEEDDELIGFCAFVRMSFFESDEDYLRILAFVISKKQRRQGIGRLMLDELKDWCYSHDISALVLNSGIRDERSAAHHFYMDCGFTRKSYGYSLKL